MTPRESAAPKPGTITKRRDFIAARNGARFHGRAFVLQARMREADGEGLRFGITATKKLGNAVARNRIKRRLRAAIASADLPLDAAADDRDVVIIARQDCLTLPFALLVEDLRKGMARLVAKGGSKGQ